VLCHVRRQTAVESRPYIAINLSTRATLFFDHPHHSKLDWTSIQHIHSTHTTHTQQHQDPLHHAGPPNSTLVSLHIIVFPLTRPRSILSKCLPTIPSSSLRYYQSFKLIQYYFSTQCDGSSACYDTSSNWDVYGRWIVLAAIILFVFFLFLAFS